MGYKKTQADGGQGGTDSQADESPQQDALQAELPLLLSAVLQKRREVTVELHVPYMHLWGKSDAHARVLRGATEGASRLQTLDILQARLLSLTI